MAVPASKRKRASSEYVKQARIVYDNTMQIMRKWPRSRRHLEVTSVVRIATEALMSVMKADSIYAEELCEYEDKLRELEHAHGCLKALANMVDTWITDTPQTAVKKANPVELTTRSLEASILQDVVEYQGIGADASSAGESGEGVGASGKSGDGASRVAGESAADASNSADSNGGGGTSGTGGKGALGEGVGQVAESDENMFNVLDDDGTTFVPVVTTSRLADYAGMLYMALGTTSGAVSYWRRKYADKRRSAEESNARIWARVFKAN